MVKVLRRRPDRSGEYPSLDQRPFGPYAETLEAGDVFYDPFTYAPDRRSIAGMSASSSPSVVHLAKFVPEEGLSPQARSLIEYTIKAPQRRRVTRETIVEQFNETFQLIGGVPRLAIWADQNPTQFYALYSKLLPAAIKAEMVLPPNLTDLSHDQIRELTTDQLKQLLLIQAGQFADDAIPAHAPAPAEEYLG